MIVMPDCQFCAEMPAVVNQRWCEPCWAEICEAGKRVEELGAFYKRVEALSKPDTLRGLNRLKMRLSSVSGSLRAHLAAVRDGKLMTTVKLWRGKK